MASGKAIVFGGTGFLGRRIVQHLLGCGWSIRVASRHPERAIALFPDVRLGIESIHADINDDRSVTAAVAAVEGVVNAVSLYVENGRHTFDSVHVTAAARIARLAREAGVEQLIWSCPVLVDGSRLRRVRSAHGISFRIRLARDSPAPSDGVKDCRSPR